MDQSTFTSLTGITLSTSQSARFDSVAEYTSEMLEELLGWPLDPSDWDDQYVEIGKTKDDWFGPDVDTSDLLPPDTVQGQLRVYRWGENDRFLFTDPLTTVHAVKLVKNGITYRTFKPQHYRAQMTNEGETYARYIELDRSWIPGLYWPILWAQLPELWSLERGRNVQVAIDADWLPQDTLPMPLQRAWAEQIAYELDLKRDIKSESMPSHSYTKNPRDTAAVKYATTLCKYAGPNGTAQTELFVV